MAAGATAHAGGPEGVNPFWDDPKNRSKHVEAMEKLVETYEDTLPENEQLIFALAKSDNRNIAVFILDASKGVDDEDCITPRWLLGDAKHREKTLAGAEDTGQPLIVEMNTLEKAFLGCTVEDGSVSLTAFDQANLDMTPEIELVKSQGTFWLRSSSFGAVCRVDRGYVQMAKGTTRRVESVTVTATDMDGNEVERTINNLDV